jgi:plasmid stabilization system protein ParE
MPQVIYTADALDDLIRLHRFLRDKSENAADKARGEIRSGIARIAQAPMGHRPVDGHPNLRDLVVRFGANGYIVRYRYIVGSDIVILRIRHQREAGFENDLDRS